MIETNSDSQSQPHINGAHRQPNGYVAAASTTTEERDTSIVSLLGRNSNRAFSQVLCIIFLFFILLKVQ